MILGHHAIEQGYKNKLITIDPFDPKMIGPNSYDVQYNGRYVGQSGAQGQLFSL